MTATFSAEKLSDTLIVPGWQDSDANHWQSIWQKEFGWRRIIQKDWFTPKREDWVTTTIQTLRAQPEPVFLVAHSLGCIAIALAAETDPRLPILGVFMVAPPDLLRADTPEEIRNFLPMPVKRLPFPSLLVASTNDPFSEVSASERLASQWGSVIKLIGKRHHIGGMANLGAWDEGKGLLLEFARTLGS